MNTSMEVWDIQDGCKRIERATFSINRLVPTTLKVDRKNIRQYSQNVCVNKGKLFLLVRAYLLCLLIYN